MVEVVFAAAALAVRVLRIVLKSPSMKVPTFFFVILGRVAALVSVTNTPNEIKLTYCGDFHNLNRTKFKTIGAIAA
ncbi:MAG TPA: hypothetical protein VED46_16310 [Alphaproteobacteria bacterium]|nr:hypothetical protein [Alphaproteobacteria bacterium]